MRVLSKSKLLAFRQCLRRLWLEMHRPDAHADSRATLASSAAGHQVGDSARRIHDPAQQGRLIDPQADGFEAAIAPATSAARKAELERQLRAHCHFDTWAMVRL